MWWRRRRREMIRIFRRQAEFLRAEEEAQLSGHIPPERRKQLDAESAALRVEMQKIAPPAPLTLKEWLLRGVIIGLALLAVGAAGVFKLGLVSKPQQVTSQGQADTATEHRFVPTTATDVVSFPLVSKVSFSDPTTVKTTTSMEGKTIGVIAQGDGVSVFYTLKRDGETPGHALARQTFGPDLQRRGEEADLFPEKDIADAAVTADGNGYLLAANIHTDNGEFLQLEKRDTNWKPVGEPTILRPMDEEEFFDGLTLASTNNPAAPYALVTLHDPKEATAILNPRRLVVRFFSPSLEMLSEKILETPEIETDSGTTFLSATIEPGAATAGFTIVTNGGSPFEINRTEKGDDLFAITVEADFSPREYFRLTNNGRPHDYMPAGGFADTDGTVYVPYVHQELPPLADQQNENHYPPNTGNVFVGIFDPGLKWTTIGTIFVTSFVPEPPKDGDLRQGGNHPHIVKVGHRLFVAYDQILTDDPYGAADHRDVMLRWFDLNR